MKTIVEVIDHHEWSVKGWQIKFLLSESQLYEIRKLSRVDNWYEDPIVAITLINRLGVCFNSIQSFYNTFASLPQVGDRLYDEDSGMLIQDRSIDGGLKTITFTLGI